MHKRKIFKFILTFSLTLCVAVFAMALKAEPVSAATASSTAGQVTVSSGNLNVRSSASTTSSIVKRLPKGSYVTLISKNGSWWKVEYANGKYGYCSASFITQLSNSKAVNVSTAGGVLNVRTGPSTLYSVKTRLSNGKTVVKLSDNGDFSRVLYNGTEVGYVSSRYLKGQAQQPTNGIKLSVPDYKQTDSRWADVTLGSSGKPISRIGCTTTALAMTESYRTGTSITPDIMSKKLTYSSSGDLYWPANYTAVTSSKGYLDTIRSLLEKGKPVILGCKKSSGSQHWVVVTGFNGGSVTASNFTINDPGTKTRTTLADFLSAYPNFYKLVYYV